VKVEYEELPAIITIPQAIAAQAFYSQQTIRKGSPDAGFAASDHVVEGELHMGGQEHFYLETQATIAVPKEGGEMEIFASTQNPTKTQMTVAKVLGVPANRIVARTKRMGGGFGGKETRSVYLSCAVAVAASKLGRPVRVMLDRDEDMISSGGRHPFYAKYECFFLITATNNLLTRLHGCQVQAWFYQRRQDPGAGN
jgi:xanthine dehydrogenase/oxidase